MTVVTRVTKPIVAVLDYGSGNIRSAERALQRVGAEVVVTADFDIAVNADGLFVPGVGAYEACMKGLREVQGPRLIGRRLAGGRPVLGVCVGMQVLFERGVEHGVETEGCGEWPGTVEQLVAPVIPHMGWNTLDVPEGSKLFAGLDADTRFYFVHSYAARKWELDPAESFRPPLVTWATHGEPFIAAVENGPLCATQFHPEKSGDAGAQVLANWLDQLRSPLTRMDSTVAGYLELLPAVDVADGQAVRLVQGAAGSETSYGDPLAAALAWQEAGAEWIHLVDLDAAFGRGSNAALLADVVRRLDVRVELSGGLRDDESLRAALATGCERVNLGTAALESPDWVRSAVAEYGDKIAVGLDVRGTTLSARGWTKDGGELYEVLARLDADGCARYVVTDVNRDGTLTGPNLQLLTDVCAATERPVVASGGVSSLDDLRALATLVPLGVEGAIVGKALYAGAFTLEEALAATRSAQ